jgi:hypothetical protein
MSVADGADLVLVTIVGYLVLRWLAASLSRRALLALGFAVVLYAISRAAGLFFTERLMRAGGSVLALTLLVAFQAEVTLAGPDRAFGRPDSAPPRGSRPDVTWRPPRPSCA